MARFSPGTSQSVKNNYYQSVGPELGGTGASNVTWATQITDDGKQVRVSQPLQGYTQGGNRASSAGFQSSSAGNSQQQPRAMNMSAYSAGRAQSMPPQSSGTPYAWQQAYSQNIAGKDKDSSFYSGYGNPQPTSPPQPYLSTQPLYRSSPQQQPQNRMPEPGFKSTTYGLDGTPMSQDAFIQQRDALIQLLNDDNARYQMQSGVGPGPGSGFQTPDFGAMWSQAGNMVQQGWKNPFAGMFG